jgi:putative MATE family efflux protein
VLRLAVPALGVLAAEPVYLLIDTAVVGHLGALALAGLAVGAVVLAQVAELTFLSYGTTSRAARLHGAGRTAEAVGEGVQASWLALGIGVLLLAVGEPLAGPITRALAGSGEVADAARGWLRIALLGAPFALLVLAGNGWLRGVQESVRPLRYVLIGTGLSAAASPVLVYGVGGWDGLGLRGSAVANVGAQVVSAALFGSALLTYRLPGGRVPLRPRPAVLRAQLRLARDLMVRTVVFQVCFLSAAAVAARTSAAAVAAHQVVLQLWAFLALLLDSLAIAAQSLVGAALGAGDRDGAMRVSHRVTRYGLVFGCLLGAVFAAAEPVLPRVFTGDPRVLAVVPVAWWFFVGMQPVAGVVFALDGVLLGAGDAAYLRTAMIVSAVLGFLPLVWISLVAGWGLAGIWSGLSLFLVLRLVAVLTRARSGRWAVTGADR